ncbi:MAG TPA: hypothetical protein VFE79_09830 [Paraburkholderia sp.]|nr:hypothetical protein [Paraburkholderia sp.]
MYIELARRLDVVSVWTDAGMSVLQKQLAAGTMKRLHLQEGTPPGKLCLAYPSVDLMTTTARDFTVWLRSYFRKSERGDQITLGAG